MSIATPSSARVLNPSLERKIMSAGEAAALRNQALRAGMGDDRDIGAFALR